MNIIFKVNNQDYQLKGAYDDFTLNRHNGFKTVKGEEVEKVSFVGNYGNVFQALEGIIHDQTLKNDATTMLELRDIYFTTITEIREIAKQFKLEG